MRSTRIALRDSFLNKGLPSVMVEFDIDFFYEIINTMINLTTADLQSRTLRNEIGRV